MQPPSRPFAAWMRDDGIVQLTPVPQPVMPPGCGARTPGDQLLPGASPLEQNIVSLFPDLAAQPLTVDTVRARVDHAKNWAFGVSMHRSLITRAGSSNDLNEVIGAAMHDLTGFSKEMTAPEDLFETVAGLQHPADLFGPSTRHLFATVGWGRSMEFALASARQPGEFPSTWERFRYSSVQNFITSRGELINGAIKQRVMVYAQSAYDIIAMWHGQPTLAEQVADQQRQQRNQSLFDAASSTANALSSAANAVSVARYNSAVRRDLVSQRKARNALRRQRNTRTFNSWF